MTMIPATAIATLTMNPTIDIACALDHLVPMHKIRATDEYANPGGGGINVARVFVRLGGNARVIYLSGGPTGSALDAMLDLHQLVRRRVAITGHTRVAVTALERATAQEYRITPDGPAITTAEWQAALAAAREVPCRRFVASGSLPRGAPADFYAQLAAIMADRDIPLVLDTSGDALRAALAGGAIDLVKPSRGELEKLVGRALPTRAQIAAAAMGLVHKGSARLVAVTLGHEGAILARAAGVIDHPGIAVPAQSTVGAGDSFVAGMVHALCLGHDEVQAFRTGIAAGTAAVLHPGTDLAHPDDIARLLQTMPPA